MAIGDAQDTQTPRLGTVTQLPLYLQSSDPHAGDPHHVRKEGFCVGSLQKEELRDVHDVALGEAQLPL